MIYYLGYQTTNGEENLSFVAESEELLKNIPCVKIDRIEKTTKQVEQIDGKFYVGADNIKTAKIKKQRNIRDYYLKTYIDSVVSNPLRWADMSDEEKQIYIDYRKYLLDITDEPKFPNIQILTLEEWKAQQ